MRLTPSVLRRALLTPAVAAAGALAGCNGDTPTASASLAGDYTATTFRLTPAGQATIDVLARGGTLSLAIGRDNATTGTLSLPPTVTGGSVSTESLTGTAVRTGNTVRFQQPNNDTFVRDLEFTVDGSTLRAENQTAGAATFTVTLTRQ